MEKKKRLFCLGLGLILAFAIWTVSVRFIDVKPIGPRESSVGFATLNGYFHSLTGVNISLYTITDWLGLVPIFIALGFAVLGLIEWIGRKSLFKVDKNILALGGFYIVVIAVYILFETVVINYRPTLIEGYLEVSYPSSTTLLVGCVMPTAMIQLGDRIRKRTLKKFLMLIISIFIAFMVIGRIVSGVHWITDIIGGVLLSAGLVALYYSFHCLLTKQ